MNDANAIVNNVGVIAEGETPSITVKGLSAAWNGALVRCSSCVCTSAGNKLSFSNWLIKFSRKKLSSYDSPLFRLTTQ